jgi:MFS family permease
MATQSHHGLTAVTLPCVPPFRPWEALSLASVCGKVLLIWVLWVLNRFIADQGVVSVLLVLPQFLKVFGRIDESGFLKGLLTAMIELGALFGALNQGWIADKCSRKYSIVIAVCVFTIGSILQTAAGSYTMLVVAR